MTLQDRADRELKAQQIFDAAVKGLDDVGYEINVDNAGDVGIFLKEEKDGQDGTSKIIDSYRFATINRIGIDPMNVVPQN